MASGPALHHQLAWQLPGVLCRRAPDAG